MPCGGYPVAHESRGAKKSPFAKHFFRILLHVHTSVRMNSTHPEAEHGFFHYALQERRRANPRLVVPQLALSPREHSHRRPHSKPLWTRTESRSSCSDFAARACSPQPELRVATPFCSCGTTAVVLGMMASTMPMAPIIAFMIASPLSSPEGLFYSAGLFGWPLRNLLLCRCRHSRPRWRRPRSPFSRKEDCSGIRSGFLLRKKNPGKTPKKKPDS